MGTPWTEDHPSTSRKTRKNHKSRGASDFQSSSARDLNYVFTQITYKNDQTNGRGGLCLSVAGAAQKCRVVGGRWVRFPRVGEVRYKIFHSTPTQAPRLATPEGLSKIDWSPTQPPTPDLFLRQLLSPLHASALSRLRRQPTARERCLCYTSSLLNGSWVDSTLRLPGSLFRDLGPAPRRPVWQTCPALTLTHPGETALPFG